MDNTAFKKVKSQISKKFNEAQKQGLGIEIAEAKKLAKINNQVANKRKHWNQEINTIHGNLEKEKLNIILPKEPSYNPDLTKNEPISVIDAKKLAEIRNDLINVAKRRKQQEIDDSTKLDKTFKPIVQALEKVENAVEKVESGVKQSEKSLQNTLLRKQILQVKQNIPNAIENKESPLPKKTMKLDEIATKYLPTARDPSFGIYHNDAKNTYFIGKVPIKFQGNDILINDYRVVGSIGIWKLLCYHEPPSSDEYTPYDLKLYRAILLKTDAFYQNNDKSNRRVKSSSSKKYKELIKPMWEQLKSQNEQQNAKPDDNKQSSNDAEQQHTVNNIQLSNVTEQQHTAISNGDDILDKTIHENDAVKEGKGFEIYNDNQIEYKYINNLNILLDRLRLISAQETAGNNNFHNEKMAILNFSVKELENVIDSPKGVEYLVKLISMLPKKCIKEGGGIFNTILELLPVELHWPGYNFLGPGTKLEKKLEAGVKPINDLDAAALEHDLYYKEHKSRKERHVADAILQERSWELFKNSDDFGERGAAWITTNTMRAKQFLGLGLPNNTC